MPTNPDPATYLFVFNQAETNVRRQEAALDELRNRTGILGAAATVAVSFLGQEAAKDGWGLTGNFAIVLFVSTIILWFVILLPVPGWKGFAQETPILLEDYVERDPPFTLSEMHRRLAERHWCNYLKNETRLKWLYWAFRIAIILLVVEVILLMYDLPT